MSPMFEVLESRDLVSTTIQGDTFDAGEMMVDGMHTAGVIIGDAAIAPSGVIISNQSVLIGDAAIAPAGVIVGDNSVFGDAAIARSGVIVGDNSVFGDATIAPFGVIIGDNSGGAQGITISEEFQADPSALDAVFASNDPIVGLDLAAYGIIWRS